MLVDTVYLFCLCVTLHLFWLSFYMQTMTWCEASRILKNLLNYQGCSSHQLINYLWRKFQELNIFLHAVKFHLIFFESIILNSKISYSACQFFVPKLQIGGNIPPQTYFTLCLNCRGGHTPQCRGRGEGALPLKPHSRKREIS